MLPPGRVDLWAADPDAVGAEALERLARGLPHDERERAAGLALPAARRGFIVTRALLRQSLSRYAGVAPEAWVFVRGPHGKPLLGGPHAALGLCFNVSHTGGLGVCAIAASDVGVDAQDVTRPLPASVLDRYLTEAERRALRGVPEGERPARRCVYWTLKEAYAKARGLGLWLPPGQIGFRLAPLAAPGSSGSPSGSVEACVAHAVLGPRCPDDGRRHSLVAWRASQRHRLALALAQSGQPPPLAAASPPEGTCPSVCIRQGNLVGPDT